MAKPEESIAYRPEEAVEVFPISRTVLYERLASGDIQSFRIGRARLIPRQSLLDFMERQLADEREVAGGAR